ncbi:pyridoxal phosphate-dependent transferase [Blastocladiella britannica]|nr:pyridoxal phosphate-dependent transferase [Blastocladiella britannica]
MLPTPVPSPDAAAKLAAATGTGTDASSSSSHPGPLAPQALELHRLLGTLMPMLVQYVHENHQPETRVVRPTDPAMLAELLDMRPSAAPGESIGAFDRDGGEPAGFDDVMRLFEHTLEYSVRTGHPLFLDKLYTGVTPIGVAAELLTGALNVNTHVHVASPVGTLMELACLAELRRMIGYPVRGGSGIMSPGGSMSNLIAMVTARNVKVPRAKTEGLAALPPLAVFTSAHTHFSIEKSAMVVGLGTNSVFRVATTPNGVMIPSDLERQILAAKESGFLPFFVNATAGTTVLCAYDPIRPIAEITKRHNLWLHVDGSWGGSVLFSDVHRTLLDGLELSDSFVVNPHKMLGVPLQCSCLLVAHPPATMASANSSRASYLYHATPPASKAASPRPAHPPLSFGDDSDDDTESAAQALAATHPSSPLDPYDLGNLGIGCGRRADGIKLYLSWKATGTRAYAARVDRAFAMSRTLRDRVEAHPRLELVFPLSMPSGDREVGANVCFWYVSPAVEARAGSRAAWRAAVEAGDPDTCAAVADVTARTRARMLARGIAMIDYAPLPEPFPRPAFFRVPMNAPTVELEHLDRLIAELVECADAVVREDQGVVV